MYSRYFQLNPIVSNTERWIMKCQIDVVTALYQTSKIKNEHTNINLNNDNLLIELSDEKRMYSYLTLQLSLLYEKLIILRFKLLLKIDGYT